MKITEMTEGAGAPVLHVSGEVAYSTCRLLQDALVPHIEPGNRGSSIHERHEPAAAAERDGESKCAAATREEPTLDQYLPHHHDS